jgi:hypothetical protein
MINREQDPTVLYRTRYYKIYFLDDQSRGPRMLNGVAEVVACTRPGHRVRRSHVGVGIDIGFGVVSVGLIAALTDI